MTYAERLENLYGRLKNAGITPAEYNTQEAEIMTGLNRALRFRARMGEKDRQRLGIPGPRERRKAFEYKHAGLATRLQTKRFELKVSVDQEDDDIFEAYFAAWDTVDRQSDLIEGPEPVNNVDEFLRDGWIALAHDQASLPVAIPLEAVQDSYGFKVKGRFHTDAKSQAVKRVVRERLKAGKRVLGNVGYLTAPDACRYSQIQGQRVRCIKSLSIYECSFVNLAANAGAYVISA
jgi:Caudovirus prohead serine protease